MNTLILFFAYLISAIVAAVLVYVILSRFEYMVCVFCKHQIPFVPSAKVLRRAIVDEINSHYGATKTVCEIGSGYGGLSRFIARKCGKEVVGIENMPMTFIIAKIANLFARTKAKTIYADAFKYLKTAPRFDVAVAYLGPDINPRLKDISDRFRVLITADVPVAGLTPRRTVFVGHGFTRYGYTKMYPHQLFIYEFD